jgi:peptide/nickel transport system substrate-binding protein
MLSPADSVLLRGNGRAGYYGWHTSAALELLHAEWMAAADPHEQRRIAERIQLQIWHDAPFVPLGHALTPTAYRTDLEGMLRGFPKFYNLRRA